MRSQRLSETVRDEGLSGQLQAMRGHDEKAWNAFVDGQGRLIAYWCHRAHVPFPDVADVVEDVFLRVVRNLCQFEPNGRPGCFVNWLKSVTHSAVVDYFRDRGRQPEALSRERGLLLAAPEGAAKRDRDSTADAHSETRDGLIRQVEVEAGERDWAIFWRAEGASSSLIAAELKMTPAGVRKCKSRVLKRLQSLCSGEREGG